jgi:hypothetical protein
MIEVVIQLYCDKRNVEIPVKDKDIETFINRMAAIGIINQNEINDAIKACKSLRKI